MKRNLLQKLKESAFSVLPITAIIAILDFSTGSLNLYERISFYFGAVLLIAGMSLYSIGTDTSIAKVGEHIGSKISHLKALALVLIACFVIGIVVTIAEPDLGVLASQVPSINKWTLIITVAVGVGIFFLLAVLRVFIKVDLRWFIIGGYALIFLLLIFVPENFVPLAFDSGGVTTGPITVPFILALGMGVSAVVSHNEDDSFGMVGICSIGPIAAVMLLGIFYKPSEVVVDTASAVFGGVGDMFLTHLASYATYLKEVAIALLPIILMFVAAQIFLLKLPKKAVTRMVIGFVYTYVGLTLFLTGANIGFMPAASAIGAKLSSINRYIMIPIGAVIGAVIVLAEPAVHILVKRVEDLTAGVINRKSMLGTLSVSMAIAVALAMVRIATGINILYILIPGYVIAIALMFFVPKTFSAVAFDSGGVASGPMTATFVLPLVIGACSAVGGNVMTDAFGVVALVAMTPLVTLQIVGLRYKIKSARVVQVENAEFKALLKREGEIIELEVE